MTLHMDRVRSGFLMKYSPEEAGLFFVLALEGKLEVQNKLQDDSSIELEYGGLFAPIFTHFLFENSDVQ